MDYKSEFQSDDDFDGSNGYSDKFQQQTANTTGQSQFNTSQGRLTNGTGLSKAELRKTNKPIMEKRRRARINHCLNELKSLILEAMKKDPARHTKLEKADILEMTVKHLQSIQRQQLNMALQTDPTVIHKFKTGFMECADEVNRYISQLDSVEDTVRQRLNNHLNNCATSLEQIGSMTNFSNGYRTGAANNFFANGSSLPLTVANNGPLFPALPQDLNNNPAAAIQMGGVQLIPSRLPSGELALIVPNTAGNATTAAAALINNNSSNSFPAWPSNSTSASSNTATVVNDFAASFKRLSAFTKPQTTLPNPLKLPTVNNYPSPTISHCNYPPQTQPQQAQGFHTTTTTSPPLSPISSISSNNEDSINHTCTELNASRSASPHQAKHPTFSEVFASPPSSIENSFGSNTSNLQQQQVSSTSSSDLNTSSSCSLKRSFSDTADSSICSEDERHANKIYRKDRNEVEDRDTMWRPW